MTESSAMSQFSNTQGQATTAFNSSHGNTPLQQQHGQGLQQVFAAQSYLLKNEPLIVDRQEHRTTWGQYAAATDDLIGPDGCSCSFESESDENEHSDGDGAGDGG